MSRRSTVPSCLFLFLFLMLGACGAAPPADPTAVLEQFFQALAKNDLPAARQCLAARERDSTWNLDCKPAQHGYSLGPCQIDGETAVVPVAIGEPKTTIPHVLVREADSWRLSLQQTSLRMTGFDPKRLREQIQDSLAKRRAGVPATLAPEPTAPPAGPR